MTTTDERAARLDRAIRMKRAAARSATPEMPPRPADEPARLGEMQRGLWLAHRLDPGSPAYNLASAFRVGGPLDPGELGRGLTEVVARHRLLRSTFRRQGDKIVQVAAGAVPLAVPVRVVGEGEVMAAAAAEAREPFALETGPLLRMRLLEEMGGGEPLLLLVLHHILADERSLVLLWQELAEAYVGRLPPGPAVPQYDDYVHWQRRQASRRGAEELDFWRRRLEPPPEELRLPFEAPPGETGGARGRLLIRQSSASVRRRIRDLAAAAGATPFTVYAFAFRLLLQRYTGGRRVAFATPVSTRSHPATLQMVGYFLNPVVVPITVNEGRRLAEALGDFGRELRELLARAALPFQRLAEELSPARRPDRHPLFQAMFVHQESAPPPRLGAARLEPVTLDLGESKFDLTLFVTEGDESLEIAVEYRADRFEEVWMESLLGHYETLLEHLPEQPERPVAELPLMGEREAERLRAAATGGESTAAALPLLPRQIENQAARAPHAPAVVCDGDRRSRDELAAEARAIDGRLRAAGVRPGDRVGLFVERSARMIAGILGCHRAGAAYVPLDPEYPRERNRGVLEDAEVAAVLTTSAQRQRLPAGEWPAIELDAPGVEAPDEDAAAERAAASAAEPSPDSVAYILYTSGSTGRPKGVVVSHDNLRASTGARLEVYAEPPRRFLLVPSVAFDSSVAGIFWTLATGGTLVIPTDEEARDPRLLVRLAAAEEVTALLCVPALYASMLEAGSDRLRGLELAIVAGEICPAVLVEEHLRRLPGARLFNEYGPTEATVWATAQELTADAVSRRVPIGRPIPGVRVEVLDLRGRPVPAGIPGEAWIGGPTVARGYWRRPELTAERFAAEAAAGSAGRRYRTGDRLAWTTDGRLLFLGREDEQIKLRGLRIEPGDIEAALLELPGVERAAVVARAGGPGAPDRLVAFVQGAPAPAEWRGQLAARLPRQMIPSRLVELPELPRLPNGKVDRQRLREMGLEPEVGGGAGGGTGVEPGGVPSDREQSLISLWEGLLGVSGIGADDNFFELGGHSLLVVEMALAIERDFEVILSAAELFQNPTIRGLNRLIERRRGSAEPPYRHLFPIQPGGGEAPLIVAVPHFFTGMFATRFRGERPVYGLRGVGLRQEGNLGRWQSLTELGAELVEEIDRRFPGEPCILAGYSFGASMAVEAARLLEERGTPARRLYLIAPMPLDLYRVGPLRLQLDSLRRPVEELSLPAALRHYVRHNSPLSRQPYRRTWRRLVIEPWRRLLCLAGKLRLRAGLQLTPRILYADVRVDRFRLHSRYRPGILRTPTVFFNAREAATDAAATWRPHFRGPFTVHQIPDPHLDDASVEAARRLILEQLRNLEAPEC